MLLKTTIPLSTRPAPHRLSLSLDSLCILEVFRVYIGSFGFIVYIFYLLIQTFCAPVHTFPFRFRLYQALSSSIAAPPLTPVTIALNVEHLTTIQ